MKKYLIIISTIGIIVHTSQSHANEFGPDGTENCSTYESIGLTRPCPPLPDGKAQTIIGADVNSIKSCITCNSGSVLKSQTLTDCGTKYTYNTCSGPCRATCGDNTTEWTTVTTGYEKRTYEYCYGTTCKTKTQYRCAAGYYGRSTDGSSGCEHCPSWRYGATTTPPDNPDTISTTLGGDITKCYIPAHTDIRDITSGTYHYTETCYYTADPIILEPAL